MFDTLRNWLGNDGCTSHHYPDASEGNFHGYEIKRTAGTAVWKIIEHRTVRCEHEGCHETKEVERRIGIDTGNALDGFFHDCEMRYEYDDD